MVAIDTLEGMIDGTFWYHYDVSSDILYLRLKSHLGRDTLGEETDDGLILLRDTQTEEPVGITVINWWQRFGAGPLPDSIAEIQKRIEPWTGKLAA